jgi:hypothetical protein
VPGLRSDSTVPVDERRDAIRLLHGVGLDLEPVSDGADDGWLVGVRQTGQGEQQLVLLGLESGSVGSLLAEVEQAAKLEAELSQATQVGRSQGGGTRAHVGKYIVIRYTSRNQRCTPGRATASA